VSALWAGFVHVAAIALAAALVRGVSAGARRCASWPTDGRDRRVMVALTLDTARVLCRGTCCCCHVGDDEKESE
jgi:hypothetical protein